MHHTSRILCELSILSFLAICLLAAGCNDRNLRPSSNFVPQVGDLLFQDLDGSPLCEAIEKVTKGYESANLTHVGIVAKDAGSNIVVLEALLKGVSVTPLDEFLARSYDHNHRPKVLVRRLISNTVI